MLYLALAVWSTWPLGRNLSTHVSVGILDATTVPLFNAWTIWWNIDRLSHGFNDYWNAPIFHPTPGAFAFSEPQPTTLLVAPIYWLSGSLIQAYNTYLLLSLTLNGIFAECLFRKFRFGRGLSRAGASSVVLLPIVHWQLDVLQLVPLWPFLWTWTACVRVTSRPDWSRGIELGIAFSIAFITCMHQGLFFALLLASSFWFILPGMTITRPEVRRVEQAHGAVEVAKQRTIRVFRLDGWQAWLFAVGLVAILIGSFIWPIQQSLARHTFHRKPEVVAQLSVQPKDYLAVQGQSWFNLPEGDERSFWRLSPGWMKVLFAGFAIVIGLRRRPWRRWTLFLVATLVLAFLLSLGPHLWIGNWQPWWTLSQYVPGFARVRNVFRFAFFVQLTAVILASQGLYFLSSLLRRTNYPGLRTPQLSRLLSRSVVTLLALLMVFEVRPAAVRLALVPDLNENQEWIDFVRDKVPAGQSIACFPFPAGERMVDFESTTRWMYLATAHRIPLVNGYSGFFPRDYFELQDAIQSGFPTNQLLSELSQRDVVFLVVDTNRVETKHWDPRTFPDFEISPVFQDKHGIVIYRLSKKKQKLPRD